MPTNFNRGKIEIDLNSKNGLLSLESRIGRPVMLIGDSTDERKREKKKKIFASDYLIYSI